MVADLQQLDGQVIFTVHGNILEKMNNFTRPAQSLWSNIPSKERLKILNSVWCGDCKDNVTMLDIVGRVDHGDLVLNGRCDRCGNKVGRLIESH